MAITKSSVLEFGRNMHSALLRVVCIFIGIFMMGVEAFFGFYFLHMILMALMTFHNLDSDIDVQKTMRTDGTIGWRHLGYLCSLHLLSSLLVLAFYWSFITLFDRHIAPGTIDVPFARLYALIVLGNLIAPLTGIVKAKAPYLVQEVVLRGHHAATLLCIAVFAIAGIDPALLPYAWLIASLVMTALRTGLAAYYLLQADRTSPTTPFGSQRASDLWQSILTFSAIRTDRRVTFLGAKAVISALLGPFAGLTLKAVGFSDDERRRRYAAKVGKRWPVRQIGRRLADTPAQRISSGHVLWIILILSMTALAVLLIMSGQLDPLVLLGFLALSSKTFAISLRALLLRKLTS